MNISVTAGRSGSINVYDGSPDAHSVFAPGDNPDGGSGSIETSYKATEFAINATTHSDFSPYMTTVGLYNADDELLAIAKLSQPILKSKSREALIKVKLDF